MKYPQFFSITALLTCLFVTLSCRTSNDEPSQIASSQPKACTPDVNAYGYPSGCVCQKSLSYNPKTGQCDQQQVKPTDCTPDINAYGYSSFCACPGTLTYDAKTGTCQEAESLKPTDCTPDVNPYGYPSTCACPGTSTYYPQTGTCRKSN